MTPNRQEERGATADPADAGTTLRRIPVEALLGPGREVVIVHAGREYRLRITQNGRLILTA